MEIQELNKVFSTEAVETFNPKTTKTAQYMGDGGSVTDRLREGDMVVFPPQNVKLDSFEIDGIITKKVPCVVGVVTRGTVEFPLKFSVNAFRKLSYGTKNEQILAGENPTKNVHSVDYIVIYDEKTNTTAFSCKNINVLAPIKHYFAKWDQATASPVLLPGNFLALKSKSQLIMSNK